MKLIELESNPGPPLNAAALSEHGLLITFDIWPGSAEKSKDDYILLSEIHLICSSSLEQYNVLCILVIKGSSRLSSSFEVHVTYYQPLKYSLCFT
jgi:hypothetical protein